MSMKKSFVLYKDSYDYLKELSDSDFGVLMKAVFEYSITQKEMHKSHPLYLAFAPIKNQLDRDNEKYKSISETNKINGSKGGKRTQATATKRKRIKANQADNDSDNVNDNVIENKNDNVNKFDFKKSLSVYVQDDILVNEFLEVRKKKKLVNSQTAFDGLIREIEKSGKHPAEIIRKCVEKSWGGFESKWLNENNITNGKSRQSTEDAIRDFITG